MASEIALKGGDKVSVVDARETNLTPPGPATLGVGNTVAIQGYVESPGVSQDFGTFGSVHASSQRIINDPRSVWMLVRPAPTGQAQQVFILPDRMVAANGSVAAAPTQEGDVYTYTILPQVPIVFETLLARVTEAEKCKCLRELQARKEQCQERRQTRFERVCGCVSNTWKCIPMPGR